MDVSVSEAIIGSIRNESYSNSSRIYRFPILKGERSHSATINAHIKSNTKICIHFVYSVFQISCKF